MNILSISILVFILMESANVIILYFKPEFKYGNGVAVFNEWEHSKQDNASHLFCKYLVRWVAGTKLIFIFLLTVILIFNDNTLSLLGVIAMIISISSYYVALHPIIKKLDKMGFITPKGYSKTLFKMITFFMVMFSLALVFYLIF